MELTKYKAALVKNPNDPAALRALGEQAAGQEKWDELVDFLHKEAAMLPDGIEKADLLFRAGRIKQRNLNDLAGALSDFNSASALAPGFTAIREAQRSIYISRKDWESLAVSFDRESEELSQTNPARAAALDLIRADIYRYNLADAVRSEQSCRTALSRVPDFRAANAPLFEIYIEQERWQDLEPILDNLSRTSPDPADKTAWEFLKAVIIEMRLNEPAKAFEILNSSIALFSPEERIAMPFTATAHLARIEMIESGAVSADPAADVKNIIDIALTEADAPAPEWRAAILYRLGERLESADNFEAALDIYKEAHILTPGDPRPLRSMARLQRLLDKHEELAQTLGLLLSVPSNPNFYAMWYLKRGMTFDMGLGLIADAASEFSNARQYADSLHAIELYASALRRLERWEELAELLGGEAEMTQDPKLKAALWLNQAEVCRHGMKDPAQAAVALRQALGVAPTALAAVRSISDCYLDSKDMENCIRAIMGQDRLVGDAGYLTHLGLLAGDMWMRMQRDDEALKCFTTLVQRDKNCIEALLDLEEICRKQKSDKNLYGVQRRLLDCLGVEDEAYRRAVLLDNASLLLRSLGNPAAAKLTFEEVAGMGTPSAAALMELRFRAYEENRWPDYIEIASREAEISGRPASLLFRIALLAWAKENRWEEALALIESITNRRSPDTALLASLALIQYHHGDYIEWLRWYGETIALVTEPSRSMLFWQMGFVHHRRLDSPKTAIECFTRMTELNPSDPLACESIKAVAMESLDYDQLLQAHNSLVDIETDDAGRINRLFCRAELAETMGNVESAAQDFARVIELDPKNIAALRRIERLYASMNNPSAQIEMLNREITLRSDIAVLVLLYLRLGALWEFLARPAEAIAAYSQASAVDPNELDALEALRRLHWQQEHWSELSDVLDIYAKATPDPDKKVQLYHEKARVSEEKLSNIAAAVSSLEAALEVDPKNIDTLSQLERLYEITESWQKELHVLSRQLELLRDNKAMHRVHFKMGSIYEEKLDAPTAAIDGFVKAHELEPQHLRTLDALERLYDRTGEAEKLVPILEEKSILLPEDRIRLYLWIGKLWEQSLGDPNKSIYSYLRVTDLDPKNLEALNHLETLYGQTGQWDQTIYTLTMKADAVPDTAQSVELLCRAGGLYVEKFNDDDQALQQYLKALAKNPKHLPAIEAAREIAARSEKWDEVVGLYAKEIEFSTDPHYKAGLLAASGKVIEEKIGDVNRAAAQYELALRSNPNAQEAVRPLSRIYFHQMKWQQAEPLYIKYTASLADADAPDLCAEIYYEQGRVYHGLNRDKESLDAYLHSVRYKPDYIEPLEARAELYAQRQDWVNAISARTDLLKVLESKGDSTAVGASLKLIGDYQDRLSRVDEAIASYNRAIDVLGENAEILENLVRLYSTKSLYNSAAGILDRIILVHRGTPEESSVWFRKGSMLEEYIRDNELAIKSYDAALAINPNYVEAHYRRAKILTEFGRWDDAEFSARKVLEIEKQPERVADAYCFLGRIALKGRHDLAAARAAYDKALQTIPGHIAAMDAIGSIIEEQGDWQGYIKTFEQFLKSLPPAARDRALQIHLRMGQVWRDKLNDRNKAMIEFNNAVRVDADCQDAHAALAGLYMQDKITYPPAIRENIILLKAEPFRVQSFKDIAKIFEEQREVDKAFCSYAVLEFFGSIDKWDRTNFEARLPHLPLHSQKSVDDDVRDKNLIHPAARHPATSILSALGGPICKVFGGARISGDKSPPGHAARKMAEEIASNLGVETFDIYFDNSVAPAVSWAASSPPAIIINPRIFDGLDERGRRFLIGRGLEGVANGLFAAWGVEENELRKRLQVAAKVFKSDTTVGGISEKDAAGLAKQLKKEVPRKVKKGLDEVADAHRKQEHALPFAAWLKALEHSANRGGLVVCAHSGVACRSLLIIERLAEIGAEPARSSMEKSEQLQELLRFIVSDQHFAARKRAGFSFY